MANKIILNETSYYGVRAIREIANEAKTRELKKALICPDPDLIKLNVTIKVTEVLEGIRLAYEIYSSIKPNPTTENVQTGIIAFRAFGVDYITTIGGGSPIDTSRAIGIIIINPEFEDVRSLKGATPAENPYVLIIVIPTTVGMAVEAIINYAVTDVEKKRRFVCVDTHDIPIMVAADPEMIASMPKGLTAATDTDAPTHAIEGYTTKGAWEMADMFNLKAIEVIAHSLRDAVESRPEGREDMTLGQYLTGMGSPNYGLGVVHSMVHGLGALYDTPHGVANAIILPAVMEYNAPYTGAKFKDTAIVMDVEGVEDMSQEEHHKVAVDAVEKLSQDVGIPADLKGIVKPEDVDFSSQSAMGDTCRPGNPRDLSLEDIKNLYLSLM